MPEKGVDLKDKYLDCGESIFTPEQDMKAGGSGCGCSAVVLNAYLLKEMMSKNMAGSCFGHGRAAQRRQPQQGESIPGVAHGIVFERRMG